MKIPIYSLISLVLLAVFAGCASRDIASQKKPLPVGFTFWRLALDSPFPWNAHEALVVDVSGIREANPTALPWHALKDAKFFRLPGNERFNQSFSAYGWSLSQTDPDPAVGHHGFFVSDSGEHILLWERYQTPSYFAALDIELDGDLDIIARFRHYGTAGNGSEVDQLFLNDHNVFRPSGGITAQESMGGQENKAGPLTWIESKDVCAIFDGEELEVQEKIANHMLLGRMYAVHETYVPGSYSVRLATRSITEVPKTAVKYLTFR
jgi:hypothetical protein